MKKKIKIVIIVLLSAIVVELCAILLFQAYAIYKKETAFTTSKPLKEDKKPDKKPTEKNEEKSVSAASESKLPISEKAALGRVDASYFDDAIFLGDSRTVGLRAFGSFTNSGYFAKTGISVNSFFMYPATDEETGLTLERTLSLRQYRKIYIMIGVNDIGGIPLENFESEFFDAVAKIKELQPEARIYIQSILGVTKNKELSDSYHYNNEKILERNALLKSKCDGDRLVYLNVFSAFSDADGYLNRECSSDGLHLNSSNYNSWCEYLMDNAIPD